MKITLDADCMQTKEEAHCYLKQKLDFPEYYGDNLDALYDCLCEYDELEIVIFNCKTGVDRDDYLEQVCSVMEDAGTQVERFE